MMETSNDELRFRARKIKWFFCDIDGTLTDGGIYYSPQGEMLKKFSLRDGTGFFLLRQCEVKAGFITTERSPIVERRAEKLKIDKYICGTHQKLEAVRAFLDSEGLSLDSVAYIGDELNDVKLLAACGLGFAVGDACHSVKDVAHIVCQNHGGHGAFREAVEMFLALRGVDIRDIITRTL